MIPRSARFVAMFCLALAAAAGAADARAQGQTYLDLIATDLNWPAYTGSPPGDSKRLFTMESLYGNIFVVDLTTRTWSPTPFLHIDDLPNPINVEQGLLGMAFDPNFATNGYFYINYTGSYSTSYIKRYRVLGDPMTSNVADPASGEIILSYSQPQTEHKAGWMSFGPNDGYLYVTTGDGGCCNDDGPGHTYGTGNAQDITDNLLGKVLRIDVHGDDFPDDPLRNYAIPRDNPFVGREGDDEIWAYGLRNPWRASFDRVTGDLWIGDVGESAREEIDFQPASSRGGENYGWRVREGSIPNPVPGIGGDPPAGSVEPIYDYSHFAGGANYIGSAVIGGFVYRGPVKEFYGDYIFADHISGNIWKLDPDAIDVRASVTKINNRLIPNAGAIGLISSFGEDNDGNLYLTRLFNSGSIFRVATTALDAVWQGDNADSGNAGDGTSWQDANNWERGNLADQPFFSGDNLIIRGSASHQVIDLGGLRTAAAVTFETPTLMENGTLQVLSGNVTVAANLEVTLTAALTSESVNHSLRKLGPGTLIVNSTSGQMVVKEGTLGGIGTFDHLTVRDGGTLAPGDPLGTVTVSGKFIMNSGARLEIGIGRTGSGPGADVAFDQVLAGGEVKLSGELEVMLVGNGPSIYTPKLGDIFPIVETEGSLTGVFENVQVPSISPLLDWRLTYTSDAVYLYVKPALAGDFNADGLVDSADYTVWRNSLGLHGWNLPADSSGPNGESDGVVDTWDFICWKSNYGRTLGDEVQAVPEPASCLLLAVAVVTLFSSRRIRRRVR